MPKYYKMLNLDLTPCHGGSGQYVIDQWMPPVIPKPCLSGYHVTTGENLMGWLGPAIHPAELNGKILFHGTKAVAQQIKIGPAYASWIPANIYMLAIDFAEDAVNRTSDPILANKYLQCARLRWGIGLGYLSDDLESLFHQGEDHLGKMNDWYLHTRDLKMKAWMAVLHVFDTPPHKAVIETCVMSIVCQGFLIGGPNYERIMTERTARLLTLLDNPEILLAEWNRKIEQANEYFA